MFHWSTRTFRFENKSSSLRAGFRVLGCRVWGFRLAGLGFRGWGA